jgi:ligand-binding sensor domain-containing protein
VNTIEPGNSGAIWFGLDGGGVRRYREGASRNIWQYYGPPDVSQNVIQSIAADLYVNGDVWVATTYGVSRFMPSVGDPEFGTWVQYLTPDLPNNQVYCSAVNYNDNTIWFGTANGIGMYNDLVTDWIAYEIPDPYNYRILAIDFDLTGKVFLGKLEGASIYNRNSSTFTHFTGASTGGQLPAGPVNAVASDLGSTVWFGTDNGLARLRDTTWTLYTTANTPTLPSNKITAVAIDRRENVWIGTDFGVAVFNENGTRF